MYIYVQYYFLNKFLFPDEDRPSFNDLIVGNATRSFSVGAVQYFIVWADLPVAPHFGQI